MRNLWTLAAAFLFAASLGSARASTVTLTGTDFIFQYDDTALGLFGTPTVVGDTIYFTPTSFFAESGLNGLTGAQLTRSTVNFTVTAKSSSTEFGSAVLAERGDYILTGAAGTSSVGVTGQLLSFNVADPFNSATNGSSIIASASNLTVDSGTPQNWTAGASIGMGGPTYAGIQTLNLTIENLLTASASGSSTAYIEKKFAGSAPIAVTVSVVPLPPSALLFPLGVLALGWLRRRSPQ